MNPYCPVTRAKMTHSACAPKEMTQPQRFLEPAKYSPRMPTAAKTIDQIKFGLIIRLGLAFLPLEKEAKSHHESKYESEHPDRIVSLNGFYKVHASHHNEYSHECQVLVHPRASTFS